jgi:hypothetical protein
VLSAVFKASSASEWKRAAIVWAFTTDENKGGRGRTGKELNRFTITGLAQTGAMSKPTIIKYGKAWKLDQSLLAHGHPDLNY